MAWWIVPAVQAAASAVNYATRKKPPKFDSTAYGKELRRIKTQGMYSPQARQQMVGQVSSSAGNVAQGEKADIRGNLVAGGMNNSIAGQRLLAEPGRERMRQVSGASDRISTANELSKTQAASEYGRAKMQYQEGARQENNQARSDLLGGLVNAGANAVSGYKQEKQEDQFDAGMSEVAKLRAAGKPEEAKALLQALVARSLYAY